jgi:predicted phage terminase large subunit-like protein
MSPTAEHLIRSEFTSFVRKAYRHDHLARLGKEPYVDYLCHELDRVAEGKTRRLVINLPPRHLKSFLAGVYLPSARIMVITYSEELAQRITYQIRLVLRSPWYRALFQTRVAKDRSQAGDFATTKGGSVFATSIGGALAGRGADLIIFDDPLDLKDAGNIDRIELVNQRFDSLVMSRLNNPKTGCVVIIAHRLNEKDLSAHVREQGGWHRVVLPLIAMRKKTYDLGYGTWVRQCGELLRPGIFTPKQLRQLRQNTINPDFELFYQQGVGGRAHLTIKAKHFGSFDLNSIGHLPVVLSIDPGLRGGASRSYCVIQAWSRRDETHLLLEQWREQCGYKGLRSAYWRFARKFRPGVALIEATANGPALISDAKRRQVPGVVEITPDRRSKGARLLAHVPLIRKSRILLPESASWRADYIKELASFPSTPFDDQVDATTQYLDWIAANAVPPLPPERAVVAGVSSQGILLNTTGSAVVGWTRGGVMVKGRK